MFLCGACKKCFTIKKKSRCPAVSVVPIGCQFGWWAINYFSTCTKEIHHFENNEVQDINTGAFCFNTLPKWSYFGSYHIHKYMLCLCMWRLKSSRCLSSSKFRATVYLTDGSEKLTKLKEILTKLKVVGILLCYIEVYDSNCVLSVWTNK